MVCFIVLLFADGRGCVLPLSQAPPLLMCEKSFQAHSAGIRQKKYGASLHDAAAKCNENHMQSEEMNSDHNPFPSHLYIKPLGT